MTALERIAKVLELDGKATEGPLFWNAYRSTITQQDPTLPPDLSKHQIALVWGQPMPCRTEDMEAFAHYRTAAPDLARRLKVAVEAIEGAPHEPDCEIYDGLLLTKEARPCTCWKSRALEQLNAKTICPN